MIYTRLRVIIDEVDQDMKPVSFEDRSIHTIVSAGNATRGETDRTFLMRYGAEAVRIAVEDWKKRHGGS